MWKNGTISKIRLILKLKRHNLGKKTIAIHILPNISRSKGNRTIKFGQLIEHNKRNIFLEKSHTKVVEKLFPDLFLKNQN